MAFALMPTILFVIILFINPPVITRTHAAHAARGAHGTLGRPDPKVRGPRSEAQGTLSGLRNNTDRPTTDDPTRAPSPAVSITTW